jgi:glycosyltransferase involved in cell wall biosynthesis
MPNNHSLSLIILTRNRCEELLTTLSSLKSQDTDFELVVVDNGSSDGTPERVREFWPGVVLIELDSNHSVPVGRNGGIGAATGDILVFVDEDASFASFASKDALTRIRKRFEKDPRLGILATNSHLASTGKPEIAAIPRREWNNYYFCKDCTYKNMMVEDCNIEKVDLKH